MRHHYCCKSPVSDKGSAGFPRLTLAAPSTLREELASRLGHANCGIVTFTQFPHCILIRLIFTAQKQKCLSSVQLWGGEEGGLWRGTPQHRPSQTHVVEQTVSQSHNTWRKAGWITPSWWRKVDIASHCIKRQCALHMSNRKLVHCLLLLLQMFGFHQYNHCVIFKNGLTFTSL